VRDTAGLIGGWFRLDQPEPGVFLIEEPLHDERVKSYLIAGEERAVLLDAGLGVGDLRALVRDLIDRPLTVVLSHSHWDHIGGVHRFVGEAPVLIHAAEAPRLGRGVPNDAYRRYLAAERLRGPLPAGFDLATATIPPVQPTRLLGGGEAFELGGRTIDVLDAPGHSPGLLALLDRASGLLFGTDVAYRGSLYAQFPDSDLDAYRTTMSRLAELAPSLRAVYPAHGDTPMDPALLVAMRDGLDAIAAGRSPDDVHGGVARHEFAGFAVLVAIGATEAAQP